MINVILFLNNISVFFEGDIVYVIVELCNLVGLVM